MINLIKFENFLNFKDGLKNLEFIVIFEIEFNKDKNLIKKQLEKIDLQIKENELENVGIIIKLFSIESFFNNIITNLHKNFDLVIGLGGLNKVNRYFIENTKVDFLLDCHNSKFKIKFDFLHHFNSGLNHIVCKLAKSKNTNFMISLNFLNNYKSIIFQKEIARINQNLKFFKKYKLNCHLFYFIEKKEDIKTELKLKQILEIFKISKIQIKVNQNILKNQINKKRFEKSSKFICEDIKLI
jgi:RNase P/RNase MRP subunit p30